MIEPFSDFYAPTPLTAITKQLKEQTFFMIFPMYFSITRLSMTLASHTKELINLA